MTYRDKYLVAVDDYIKGIESDRKTRDNMLKLADQEPTRVTGEPAQPGSTSALWWKRANASTPNPALSMSIQEYMSQKGLQHSPQEEEGESSEAEIGDKWFDAMEAAAKPIPQTQEASEPSAAPVVPERSFDDIMADIQAVESSLARAKAILDSVGDPQPIVVKPSSSEMFAKLFNSSIGPMSAFGKVDEFGAGEIMRADASKGSVDKPIESIMHLATAGNWGGFT